MANKELPKEVQIALSAAEQIRQKTAQDEVEADESTSAKIAAATVLASAGTGNSGDLQQEALKALIDNLTYDMAKKRSSDDTKRQELERLVAARNADLKFQREQQERTQQVCDHRKENGKTRIGGQKLSNNKLSLMCNLCYKTFDENSCPPHLAPGGDVIGG